MHTLATQCREKPHVQEVAGSEVAHLPFIDERFGEDELVDILENRELGSADAVSD
jgi:hypothetical protein